MASQAVIGQLLHLIGSGVGAIFTYYLACSRTPKEKKKIIDRLFSYMIRVVLVMWTIKIVRNVSLFIEDPLPVLAYPSDTFTFYLALFLVIGHAVWELKKEQQSIEPYIVAVSYTMLLSLFFYEAILVIVYERVYHFPSLVLFFIVWSSYSILLKRSPVLRATWITYTIWTIGTFIAGQWIPVVPLFQFRLGVYVLMFVTFVLLIMRWKQTRK